MGRLEGELDMKVVEVERIQRTLVLEQDVISFQNMKKGQVNVIEGFRGF